jgi:hypothetical protein
MGVRPAAYVSTASSLKGSKSTSGLTYSAALRGTSFGEREIFALLGLFVGVYAVMLLSLAGDLTIVTPTGGQQRKARSKERWAEETHTLLSAQAKWLTLSGLHVLGSAVIVAWIYLFHSRRAIAQTPIAQATANDMSLPEGFSLLANGVTFTAALMNMLFWGYLWSVIRDEGREVGKAVMRRREIEREDE